MKLSDIVFVPSVQHTGTFFVINFLKNFIPRSTELTFLLEDDAMKPEDANILYRPQYSQPLNLPTIIHNHLPIIRNPELNIDVHGSWFDMTMIMNLTSKRSLPVQFLLLICNFFKTVIPIRDPMAAILTREVRHPQLRHFFIIDGYVALATEFANHPNVKFLPIDITEDTDYRRKLLDDVLVHCSIDPTPHLALLDQIASEWIPQNITPGNRFKEAYENNDLDKLREMLGPKWAEVEYLRNRASIIQPFLVSLGYTRDKLRY